MRKICLRATAPEDSQRPAVTTVKLGGVTETLTRGELRQRVFEFAGALRALEVKPGDRVVSVLRNDAGSVVAALGSAAVGATFSSAASGMGVSSLVSRFGQLRPVVLIVSSIDSPGFESERLLELARGLTTLRSVVILDDCPIPPGFSVPVHRGPELALGLSKPGEWTRYPFNHPLYILFSSGTTGIPKCIVHGAGGTLLEHMKEHVLHGDLRRGDKLFFHTSASWMMWNWQLSALACFAEIVLYDGPAVDPRTLWSIVAQERVTVFGTSPAYLRLCQIAGYSPKRELDLSSLRSIMSTGEILHDDQFEWARDNVRQIPVQSISGRHRHRRLLCPWEPKPARLRGRIAVSKPWSRCSRTRTGWHAAWFPSGRVGMRTTIPVVPPRHLRRCFWRAIPRDLLLTKPRSVDARRLGRDHVPRHGTHARPLRRHNERAWDSNRS